MIWPHGRLNEKRACEVERLTKRSGNPEREAGN